MGHAELLLGDLPEADPRCGDVEEIRLAAARATALTRQLLTFSRRQLLQVRVLDLNAVITGMKGMLARLIGEDVELVSRLEHGVGMVEADPSQMEQVLLNLAINARDAMPHGGRLTIQTAGVSCGVELTRAVPAARSGDFVRLSVTDTGIGMTPALQARIFEPFFTTKEAGKGTGLGLATVYGIVKQAGGFILVESEPSLGASFQIFLPRASAATPDLATESVEAIRGGTETILLVEDEPQVRAVARRVLERAGYQVLEAANGAEAIEVSRALPGDIHLVLTDVVMPGQTGPELVHQLRDGRPGIRAVLTSGYPGEAIASRGVASGELVVIVKPFTAEGLTRAVRSVLDQNSLS
jgi:CheY-like chemotaxis protein